MIGYGSGFVVRLAKEEDIPKILEITQTAFKAYIELAGISDVKALNETAQDVLQDIKGKMVLVAYLNDEPVGSVRIELRENNRAYLSRFGVDPAYQNDGVGKAMMSIVDLLMEQNGVKQIELHTASQITSLVRFYYGRGYYIESTDKDDGYIRARFLKDYK